MQNDYFTRCHLWSYTANLFCHYDGHYKNHVSHTPYSIFTMNKLSILYKMSHQYALNIHIITTITLKWAKSHLHKFRHSFYKFWPKTLNLVLPRNSKYNLIFWTTLYAQWSFRWYCRLLYIYNTHVLFLFA